jgi:hypothetical protein
MLEAKRTLVKSAPELWAEISDPAALARHLAPFGSVRIVRAAAQSVVEWEGEKAAGAVALHESGFGTRVTVTAGVVGASAEPEPEPEPPAAPATPEPPRAGFWARLLRRRPEAAAPPEPEPAPAPVSPPQRIPAIGDDAAALLVLTDMLDALGRAHHRPFSRT